MSMCTTPVRLSQVVSVAAAVAAAGWDVASLSQEVASFNGAAAAATPPSPAPSVYNGMLEHQKERARAASAAAAAAASPGQFVPGFGVASIPPAGLLDSPARAAAPPIPPPYGVCGAAGCGRARFSRMCAHGNGANAGRTFLHCPLSKGNNEHNNKGFAWRDEWLEDQPGRRLPPEDVKWRQDRPSYKLRPHIAARLAAQGAAAAAPSPPASQSAPAATPS